MDKVSYAIGISIAQMLQHNGVSTVDFDDVALGMKDILECRGTSIPLEEASTVLDKYIMEANHKMNERQKTLSDEFIEKNKSMDGVHTTETGLQYRVNIEGNGEKPTGNARVRVHYRGTFLDGTVFGDSYHRGVPSEFNLNEVIPGWTEGLKLMSVGSEYTFYVPYQLAYGATGSGETIPPFAALIFTIQLIEILPSEEIKNESTYGNETTNEQRA